MERSEIIRIAGRRCDEVARSGVPCEDCYLRAEGVIQDMEALGWKFATAAGGEAVEIGKGLEIEIGKNTSIAIGHRSKAAPGPYALAPGAAERAERRAAPFVLGGRDNPAIERGDALLLRLVVMARDHLWHEPECPVRTYARAGSDMAATCICWLA